jgi:hypothetical protein
MATTPDTSGFDSHAFDRGTTPVMRFIPQEQAQKLVQYQADESLRQRIDELGAKSNQGTLTASERAEYEGYVRANKFVAVLQAQARKILGNARPF